MNGKSNRWLYPPILILGIYFIIRLIDQSQLFYVFPLDYTNDISSYMASVFFLSKCGFHEFCPYWYNGFLAFKGFSLGWSLFTLPIYLLTKNILFATFTSIILMYIIAFIFLIILGRIERFPIPVVVAFFLFLFGNAIAIGDFLRLGRTVSMFAFVLFIGLVVLTLYYKDNKIDMKFFFLFIPLYATILISHQQEMFLSQFVVLSLFLVKQFREKIKIILSSLTGFLLSSFWLVPFLLNLKNVRPFEFQGKWLIQFTNTYILTNIASIIIPVLFLVLFYKYWNDHNKSRRELLFFSPILVVCILFLFKLTIFIPLFKNISPDPYLMLFLFFSIFLFFKTKFGRFGKVIYMLLILVSILNVAISAIHTPYFIKHSVHDEEIISLLSEEIKDKFIIISTPPNSFSLAYYSYAAIYYNLTTPDGWYRHMVNEEYLDYINNMYYGFLDNDCERFNNNLRILNATEVIGYLDDCKKLKECGLEEKIKKTYVCLYHI